MARRMRHVCFAMSLQCEWRINHVFPLSITEVIDHKLSLLFSGTHGSYVSIMRTLTSAEDNGSSILLVTRVEDFVHTPLLRVFEAILENAKARAMPTTFRFFPTRI